ncbi:hypothetical protein PUN28_000236 [Cardiocondyla obscurior]|uniref:Uncharacterized protein n=1 Tax=Cardiocondyla obscurior TaxID=286306 RepID=A0AAW2GYG5_9HYME
MVEWLEPGEVFYYEQRRGIDGLVSPTNKKDFQFDKFERFPYYFELLSGNNYSRQFAAGLRRARETFQEIYSFFFQPFRNITSAGIAESRKYPRPSTLVASLPCTVTAADNPQRANLANPGQDATSVVRGTVIRREKFSARRGRSFDFKGAHSYRKRLSFAKGITKFQFCDESTTWRHSTASIALSFNPARKVKLNRYIYTYICAITSARQDFLSWESISRARFPSVWNPAAACA